MAALKYFEGIQQAQAASASAGDPLQQPFRLEDLGTDAGSARPIRVAILWLIKQALFLFRELWPNPKFGRLVVVTRDEDVREVLSRIEAFEVPFGPEMTEVAGGENFVLGLEDAAHDAQRKIIDQAFLRSDAAKILQRTRDLAQIAITRSGGRLNVIADLVTRVTAQTCVEYYGLDVADPLEFAQWAMSIATLLFADPTGKPEYRTVALRGSARLRAAIDKSIAAQSGAPRLDTVLGRLLAAQAADPSLGLTSAKIRAILVGMVTGFAPTTTLGAGNILQELLSRPSVWEEAKRKAAAGDIAGLRSILFEAARLRPTLFPGQWRYARRSATIATGTSRARWIPEGSVLMVSTASALRDPRALSHPASFDSSRPASSYDLVFGAREHDCIGKYLAIGQITEIFALLFAQKAVRPVSGEFGSLFFIGPFPNRLDMQFEPGAEPRAEKIATGAAATSPPMGPTASASAESSPVSALRRSVAGG